VTTPAHVAQSLADTSTLVRRTLLRYQRQPDALVILLIQPLIVLLLFRYILGGETRQPDYVEYLMPGIFALAVITGSVTIGVGLAEDVSSGLVDRLRSLPIGRSTFLAARAVTDVAKNAFIITLVGALGVAVGFNIVGSAPNVILAVVLLLALGWMFAWLSMAIALWTGSVEATQGCAFLIALVFSFASSGFAIIATMPSWLRPIARANPVTHVDDAVRTLTTTVHGSAGHDTLTSLTSIAAVLAIMIPLAITRYARLAR
jgi:ABC-2 type transport system permease protein/oleandomycin transport system permease protein